MEKNLNEKVVVITGGAEGIGYEIADKYLPQGIKVVILLDINETEGAKAEANLTTKYSEGRIVFMKCDVTKDLEEVSKKIFDTYKQVDVLVNNAKAADELSPSKTMQLNSVALMEWSMKFWEHMRKDKGGHGGTIINIGSIYSFAVDPYLIFYKASKFAVMGFSRALGHEDNFKRLGVRVLIICPGFTTTTLTLSCKQLCWEEHLSDFDTFNKGQPWQQPEEVGKAAVEVFRRGESGSAWTIIGGSLAEIPLVAEGDHLR